MRQLFSFAGEDTVTPWWHYGDLKLRIGNVGQLWLDSLDISTINSLKHIKGGVHIFYFYILLRATGCTKKRNLPAFFLLALQCNFQMLAEDTVFTSKDTFLIWTLHGLHVSPLSNSHLNVICWGLSNLANWGGPSWVEVSKCNTHLQEEREGDS